MPKRIKNCDELENKKLLFNNIDKDITSLDDFIALVDVPNANETQTNLVLALKEMQNLVGLQLLKDQVLNQILFIIQDLRSKGFFLHTVITGDAGTGKTTIINILAKIYKSLGILSKDKIVIADRTSLIAEYLGQTAIKTKNVLESAKGGILLIDEAYSLGSDKNDSYAKECIDTINQYLSEHVDDFVCIIAGYENKINKCFFSYNPGLKRRFPWVLNIEKFNQDILYNIFIKQLTSSSAWTMDVSPDIIRDKIKQHLHHFSGNGGDTRNLLDQCKIYYARRSFNDSNKQMTLIDFEEGFKTFLEHKIKKTCELCTKPNNDHCKNCKNKSKNHPSHYV